ncbi:MAG: hypothetical protein EGQ20_13055, partial [Bacteroides oleiciplenus]|nr:hypothetical protein [Bacteroides oleiciplenus]
CAYMAVDAPMKTNIINAIIFFIISSFIVLFYSNLQNKQSGNEKDANGVLNNIKKNIVKFSLLQLLFGR